MNEVQWQAVIRKSLETQGGWCRKWATQVTVGVPDLVMCHPDFGLIVAEVKLLKNAPEDFSRKLGVSSKQQHELKAIHDAGGRAMTLVVVEFQAPRRLLVGCPHDAERLSESDVYSNRYPSVSAARKGINMTSLLTGAQFRRIL